MNKEQLLKNLAEILSNNVGNKLTNELASGFYNAINQMLNTLKLDEKEDGEPKNS